MAECPVPELHRRLPNFAGSDILLLDQRGSGYAHLKRPVTELHRHLRIDNAAPYSLGERG